MAKRGSGVWVDFMSYLDWVGRGEGARGGEGGGEEGGGEGKLQEEGPDDAAGELSSNVPHAAVVAEPAGDAEGKRDGRVH